MSTELLNNLATRVGAIEKDLSDVKVSMGEVKTEITHVATKTWVLSGVIAVLVAIFGAVFWMVQQYLSPILQGLGKH